MDEAEVNRRLIALETNTRELFTVMGVMTGLQTRITEQLLELQDRLMLIESVTDHIQEPSYD